MTQGFLEMVRGALDAGAAGTSIGRNVFTHPDPRAIVHALRRIVHEDACVEEALESMEIPKRRVA